MDSLFFLLPLFAFIPLILIFFIVGAFLEARSNPTMPRVSIIRSIYFYAVSIISLFMVTFAVADLVNSGLKTWVFPNTDPRYNECIPGSNYGGYPRPVAIEGEKEIPGPTEEDCAKQNALNRENIIRERQNSAVRDFSFLVVGVPLFLFHFRIIQRERKEA